MAQNKKSLKLYLVYHTEFEAFLIMGHGGITLSVVTSEMHHAFGRHGLITTGHGSHFPDRTG